jgi:hypothetical protein
MKRAVLLVLAVLLMASPLAIAQTATGNVFGNVSDASGAVLPGASVTISGEAGTRSTVTGADGSFRFLNLDYGDYTVTISLTGFGSATRKGHDRDGLEFTGHSSALRGRNERHRRCHR